MDLMRFISPFQGVEFLSTVFLMRLKNILFVLAFFLALNASGANTKKTVDQVTEAVIVDDATDYHITSNNPFATSGSIDLRNEDAAVVFESVRPSVVIKNYLPFIYVNGEPSKNDDNVRVAIYDNGAIVYAHGNSKYKPLTVYTEFGFQGEESNDYAPRTRYTSLGEMNNRIKSFRLKRGYMVTLATANNGKGYSRVFIAQDSDMEVSELSQYLASKVSFIRVFPWNRTTKKGSASGDTPQYNALNATWFYDWSANNFNYDDYEYVPMHHHEGWPSYSSIAGLRFSNTVLGNNEPDNTNDQSQHPAPYTEVIENWSDIYTSGMRVGSPSMAGNLNGWLVPFMNLCEQRNYRVDFITFHAYWYSPGSSYSNYVNQLYNLFHRPVWLTEFNYGANWTNETSWPDKDRSASRANQEHERAGLADICQALEANPHLERYSIYNWVQDARAVFLNNKATLAGEWYGNLKSKTAYTGGEGYVPGWRCVSPKNLELTFNESKRVATLTWVNPNCDETDSTYVERKGPNDADFVVVATLPSSDDTECAFNDSLSGLSGLFTYRIRNFDSDKKERTVGTVSIGLSDVQGDDIIQYGTMNLNSSALTTTDFTQEFDATPAVFTGIPTNSNNAMGLAHQLLSVGKGKFTFRFFPWLSSTDSTYYSVEKVDFMALPYGVRHYDDGMQLIVGTAKVKGDTAQVVFDEPFPEGVIPVVVSELRPTIKNHPLMAKVWDVTNTGFKAMVRFEKEIDTPIRANQNLMYIAMSPGRIDLGNGKLLHAGVGEDRLSGQMFKTERFFHVDEQGDTLYYQLSNPRVFGSTQEHNIDAATVLRLMSYTTEKDADGQEWVTGVRVKRQVEGSARTLNTTSSGETFGWITLSDNPGTPDAIRQIAAEPDGDFQVDVKNRIIIVENADHFEVYTLSGTKVASNASQQPGVYVVKAGKVSRKVVVR